MVALLGSLLALVEGALRGPVLVADILLVLAAAYDYGRLPGPTKLEVQRSLPGKVGLSRSFSRTLFLVNRGATALDVEVYEEFPESFEVAARSTYGVSATPRPEDPTGGPDRAKLDAGSEVILTRSYRPSLRGLFSFGRLRVRVRSSWKLMLRQSVWESEPTVAVEPALANLHRTLRLAASDRWRDLGVRLLRQRGGETEFESLREYVQGDDIRRVDWKAFARRAKPMVRQYQVERGQELFLLVDCGRRMRATAEEGERRGWSKLDWALDAAFELAAVALSKGDRVGAACFDARLSPFVGAAKGERQFTRLSQALFPVQPSERESDLARALRELAARHRRRATVIVISDVADPLSVAPQKQALQAASRRHRIVFAALDDPLVREVAGGEAAARPAVRAAALELVEDRRRSLATLASSGARVLDALPADAAAPLLSAWLSERRRAR